MVIVVVVVVAVGVAATVAAAATARSTPILHAYEVRREKQTARAIRRRQRRCLNGGCLFEILNGATALLGHTTHSNLYVIQYYLYCLPSSALLH